MAVIVLHVIILSSKAHRLYNFETTRISTGNSS